jgi:hypothetical protein
MQVIVSLPNILARPPDAPLAVSSVSELCLETCANVFGRDALLAEESNDDLLVVLHPLNEKPETHGPRESNSKRTADVVPL